MPDLDIVIVNYRSLAHTQRCVAAALEHAERENLDIRIAVVNNGDDAGLLEAAVESDRVTVIHNTHNTGFGAASNAGARHGSADMILFLNPDATLLPGCMSACMGFMREPSHRRVGIVGPAIQRDDGQITPSCSPLPTFTRLAGRALGLHRLGWRTSYLFYAPRESGTVGQVMGAAMMVRRELFQSLNGFDERFFLYYEDVDLCARAARLGAASYYLKEARATHIGRASSSRDNGMALALFLQSMLAYARIHFGRAAQLALAAVSFVAELPLRLVIGTLSREGIGSRDVLRAYYLLARSYLSGRSIPALSGDTRVRWG